MKSLGKRFWKRVKKTKGCWEWQGYCARKGKGHGSLSVRALSKKPMYAHRVAWILTKGPIPKGKHVLHRCDNPPCCRPGHLFLGTQRINNLDRDAKGRTASGNRNGSRTRPDRRAVGERCGSSKMTAEKVKALRRDWATGKYTQRQLGRKYKISQQQVSVIVTGKHWRHL